MNKAKRAFMLVLTAVIILCFLFSSVSVFAYSVVLKEGMQGSEVTQLQNDLKKLGYFSADCTGYYGEVTAAAVKQLQKDYGYIQDGIAGSDTFSLIDSLLKKQAESASESSLPSSALKKGVEGEAVVELQKALKELGYFQADCTGYYGDLTASAVRNLQREYGYIQDGIAGSDTISLIKRLLTSHASRGSSAVLKMGMQGSGVVALQNDLKKLGFFNGDCTGYYGELTANAVRKLQKKHGYTQDGIAGKSTFELIDRLLGRKATAVSRGISRQDNYLVPWFGGVNKVFTRGKVATVYDIDTGLSFKVKRTYGTNHADSETLTVKDTKTLKRIYGGKWSWKRRAIIVTVDGKSFAASMNGMPHAGLDKYAKNKWISSRSGGYGGGTNFDAVKGNGMDGHICIHFYKSRTHSTNRVDSKHQAMVKKAASWAKNNY